jgi:hypothetical protein
MNQALDVCFLSPRATEAAVGYVLFPKEKLRLSSEKGGDPAAGSPTATLLRLSPDHRARRGRLPSMLDRRLRALPAFVA